MQPRLHGATRCWRSWVRPDEGQHESEGGQSEAQRSVPTRGHGATRLCPPYGTSRRGAMNQIDTDILILGAGGAGLFAALHAKKANPALDVTIAVKGLLGKCGCTRMVQGGY